MHQYYPFSAIVGQEKLKTAYLVNIINPKIGGLLISGPKGSGKSTLVHSASNILPEIEVIDQCFFNCDPNNSGHWCTLCREDSSDKKSTTRKMKVISVPLSCTEDRLIGSIDIEKLMKKGIKSVQPGLLGEANRNILYIDEINLLPDHLVDDILDSAALHWNTIQRERLSIIHPSEFVLIGTMNPEEGDLRPQILDRLSLCVKVKTSDNPDNRVEIVKRNLWFEQNPTQFINHFEVQEKQLTKLINRAKKSLNCTKIPENFISAISKACIELKVDGHRPDIVIIKTSQAIASLNQRDTVNQEDILISADLSLCHRTRDGGLLEPANEKEISDVFSKYLKLIKSKSSPKIFTPKDLSSLDQNQDKFQNLVENKIASSQNKTSPSESKKKD
ncbi:MAG: ATP-binding protein [bacterium]